MSRICIELPEQRYKELLKKSKIAQISPNKILEVYILENFFKENKKENILDFNFLNTYRDAFKELEIKQEELSEIFEVALSTISKALSGKQKNFVFKKLFENKDNINSYVKEIYFKVLENNKPSNLEIEDYYKDCNFDDECIEKLTLFFGFINKKLNNCFNEEIFLEKTDLKQLINYLKNIDYQNLSAQEIHDKFEYFYQKNYLY